jgi:hypothetical protein
MKPQRAFRLVPKGHPGRRPRTAGEGMPMTMPTAVANVTITRSRLNGASVR